ncbi:tyrosine-type recombinase/integrase [Micromonospora sp. Llam7]|uniref:tyrosine-type recombinase/integrase n=1 Tax=Micromonospora tarapacensis TaxID=2835305 RepID=UPI001C83590F|nr:tyrosine-type recombinase/integrase [Micromonospora tarapacensis]MBX7266732.1 tyrosine-type recombinase/integrase [Micromonospora tarapacensis]
MAAIRLSELQAFVPGLDLAPSSVRPAWATVRAIFGAAGRDRIIGHEPCDGIRLPELPHDEVVPLLLDQVDALAAAVPTRYRRLIRRTRSPAYGRAESSAWRCRRSTFLRKELVVDQQVQPTTGGAVMLRKARFIFVDDGQPLHRSTFNIEVWAPARQAVGLPEATMHDLRHLYASLLIRDGHSPKLVAKMLGHADPSQTLKKYAHLWPDDDDRARSAIDAAFRRNVPRLRPAKDA